MYYKLYDIFIYNKLKCLEVTHANSLVKSFATCFLSNDLSWLAPEILVLFLLRKIEKLNVTILNLFLTCFAGLVVRSSDCILFLSFCPLF